MEEVSGHLEKNGEVVVDGVKVVLEDRQERGGLKSWDGALLVSPTAPVDLDEYTLVLEDGRQGTIIVDRINHRSGEAAPDISFQGSGLLGPPLPK